MVLLSDPTTGAGTDQWGPFSDALGTWYSGGSSLVQCPQCDRMIEFNDWWRGGGPPFAVGFLGLTFLELAWGERPVRSAGGRPPRASRRSYRREALTRRLEGESSCQPA